MAWKNAGAVERGAISRPHKGLEEGAGIRDALTRKGNFAYRPHLSSPTVEAARYGLAVVLLAALTYIVVAKLIEQQPHPFRCHPGDRTTTNGRDLCPPHEGQR